ncbi:MAG: hypothetical protein IKJ35_04095 [Clostridia bacterium]|nr:hypothetical protein [Clostridia bacterium]
MYCIQCGVKLTDGERQCPLCQTEVCHPDFLNKEKTPLYPGKRYPTPDPKPWGLQLVIAIAMLIPLSLMLSIDLKTNGTLTWCGYGIGALLVGYVTFILPFWFRKPNPVIFVPVDFVCVGLYLLYINFATDGNWFLSLAFPVTGFFGLVTTAVITLLRYVGRGKLYIFGGATLALAAFMPLLEFLINLTFDRTRFVAWALYPLIVLGLLGLLLIFLAICRPAREALERRLFT